MSFLNASKTRSTDSFRNYITKIHATVREGTVQSVSLVDLFDNVSEETWNKSPDTKAFRKEIRALLDSILNTSGMKMNAYQPSSVRR